MLRMGRSIDDREDKNGRRRIKDVEVYVPIVCGSVAFYLGKKLQNIEHISGVCMYVELQMRILVWLSSGSFSICIQVLRIQLELLILLHLQCLSVVGENLKSTLPFSSIPMFVKRSWTCLTS